jgi:hypothetical protein
LANLENGDPSVDRAETVLSTVSVGANVIAFTDPSQDFTPFFRRLAMVSQKLHELPPPPWSLETAAAQKVASARGFLRRADNTSVKVIMRVKK